LIFVFTPRTKIKEIKEIRNKRNMTTSNVRIIEGNLLESGEPVIVQQLNCLCCKGHGLSQVIATRYPYADVYSLRRPAVGKKNIAIPTDHGVPGTIVVSRPIDSSDETTKNPIVVGLFGQYDYGKPGVSPRSSLSQDNYKLRCEWFKSCLDKLREFLSEAGVTSVGVPYQIGCGLGGGNWNDYQKMLEEFAQDAPFQVNLYRLASFTVGSFKCE